MLDHNGKKYARVSDILSMFCDFSAIDPKVLERKRILGGNVHEAIKADMNHDFPILNSSEIGYFNSYMRWMTTITPKVICMERRYFDDTRMLTGQIDTLALLPNEPMPDLVDWKCTYAENAVTWEMQGHMYDQLLELNGVRTSGRYLFIKLNQTGGLPRVCTYYRNKNTETKCNLAIEKFWSKNKNLDNNSQ